jgi:uncharacterized phage protein (TIGR02220 family)
MSPKIHSSFWSDGEVENLTPEQKFAFLWIMTNSQINVCGFCEATGRRFTFETGLPVAALESTLKALPRSLKHFPDAGVIYVRKFIRHQFGDNDKLVRNHIFKSIVGECKSITIPGLLEAIIADYPVIRNAISGCNSDSFGSPSDSFTSPSPVSESPSNEVGRGKEKEKEKDQEKEQGESEGGLPGHEFAILDHLNQVTGRNFAQTQVNLTMIRSRLKEVHGDVEGVKLMINRWVKKWKGTEREEYLQPSTLFAVKKFRERYDSRMLPVVQEVTVRPDVQLKALEEEITRHPANRDGSKYEPNCTQAQKDEFSTMRKKRQALVSLIANGGRQP